jgi:dienelactone hydrolase
MKREEVSFDVQGSTVRGVLFRPDGSDAAACIVLAHGFSATMDWIVPKFAERFASAGLAALVFDYRHLGRSDGTPRQLVHVKKQREDLRAAIAFARAQPAIDPARVALWGTSLGGSHVAAIAAEDPKIAAVILNMPALDVIKGGNVESKRKALEVSRGLVVLTTLRLLGAALEDALRGVLGRTPRYLEVYGDAGHAFLADPRLAQNFEHLAKGSVTWQNRVAARFLLGAPRYREGTMERIPSPMLVCLADKDVEISNVYVIDKVRRAPRAEVRTYPYGHFDLYHGPPFEQLVAEQAAFLRHHLL